METSQSVGAVQRKDEKEPLDDNPDDMQERPHVSSSGHSDLSSESPKCEVGMGLKPSLTLENSNMTSRIVDSHEEHDEPEAIPAGNLECLQGEAGREDGQVFVVDKTTKTLVNLNPGNGLDLIQDKHCAQVELGFDRLLPPIRIRREGQSSDSSPSDLSPPSPKRMRQGPKEKDQWLGLWSADESKGSTA